MNNKIEGYQNEFVEKKTRVILMVCLICIITVGVTILLNFLIDTPFEVFAGAYFLMLSILILLIRAEHSKIVMDEDTVSRKSKNAMIQIRWKNIVNIEWISSSKRLILEDIDGMKIGLNKGVIDYKRLYNQIYIQLKEKDMLNRIPKQFEEYVFKCKEEIV